MNFIELTDREKDKPILINLNQILFIREFSFSRDAVLTRVWLLPNENYIDVKESYAEVRRMICPQLSDLVDELFGDTIVAKEEVK